MKFRNLLELHLLPSLWWKKYWYLKLEVYVCLENIDNTKATFAGIASAYRLIVTYAKRLQQQAKIWQNYESKKIIAFNQYISRYDILKFVHPFLTTHYIHFYDLWPQYLNKFTQQISHACKFTNDSDLKLVFGIY